MLVINIKSAPGGEKYTAEVENTEVTVADFKTLLTEKCGITGSVKLKVG